MVLIILLYRDEMVGKVASLEASVGSFRSEMRLMAQRNEQCSTVIHDKELEMWVSALELVHLLI